MAYSPLRGAPRIVNDIVSNLSSKPKPEFRSVGDKYNYYAAITSALQRLEKLAKVSSINKIELDNCLSISISRFSAGFLLK